MNDFTKNELISIYDCLKIHGDSYCCGQSAYETLIDKLQSRIDNYCDCKETINIGGWVSKCIKCGNKFGDETQ